MKNLTKEQRNKEQNRKYKSLMRNDSKNFKLEFENSARENLSNLQILLTTAQKTIDKSVSKKIIHKNTAARKKSRLSKLFNSLSK